MRYLICGSARSGTVISNHDTLVLKGDEVLSLLSGRGSELIEVASAAYQAHEQGYSSLPASTFLSFPDNQGNRIIALPAYLGDGFETAGLKWVASFPGNHEMGLDRASAVIILNSTTTGRPIALMEGSIISAKRTAASAALAVRSLQVGTTTSVGIIGSGLINFEVTRFLPLVCPKIKTLFIFDTDLRRAQRFQDKCQSLFKQIETVVCSDAHTVLRNASLISIATTALKPHLYDLSMVGPGSVILHISLRDLSPEVLLLCDNIVDDIDHVCRARTSIHLAENLVGHRAFIRCTLGEILRGTAAARNDPSSVTVFSPFGLGILDVAIGKLVYDLALMNNIGTRIGSFLPDPWVQG